ncbi:hypothetical protein FRC04_008813 [Tulasnella sp. 424]|nr:hypothetical protein FRC04_008813 [Tulasnella sp. 424]KAG8980042.1 hypothetical protein FRC05_007485 [Tulasnella sp. 425]
MSGKKDTMRTANLPDRANERDGQPGAASSSKAEAKQVAAKAPATPGTKEAEIEAWIKAVALGSQEVPSSEPPKSEQTKRVRESVGSYKAVGGLENEVPTRSTGQLMPKKLKTSDPTEAPEAPGKTKGGKESAAKRRSEPGTGEEIEDVAVMSDEDLDGVPMEVETEVAEEKVFEGEEEDVVDEDPHIWYAMGGRTGVPGGSRTPTADDSTATDAALRFALVTEILESTVWDNWLWGPTEFERHQSWELQEIYRMIVNRTGREF